MLRVSEENSSPLIVECQKCGHREYAEVQITPPWPPEKSTPERQLPKSDTDKTVFRFWNSLTVPVSVDSPDAEGTIVPVGWILLWIIVLTLVGLCLWIIL